VTLFESVRALPVTWLAESVTPLLSARALPVTWPGVVVKDGRLGVGRADRHNAHKQGCIQAFHLFDLLKGGPPVGGPKASRVSV
jgi:hypothetical protein